MNHNGSGAYPPFAQQQQSHQGINPAMLASYSQPQQQQQQSSQYSGVSPAQLLSGMGNQSMQQRQQQHNQQQMMMMNGAGLNPSALSAPPSRDMPPSGGGGGGGMNSYMNGGPPPGMPPQMGQQMQQQQQQPPPQQMQLNAQTLHMLANVGVSREQLLAMSPVERQNALRNAVVEARRQHMQNQQAQQQQQQQQQQQHFMPDQGGYERPGSAMGVRPGSAMGMRPGGEMGMRPGSAMGMNMGSGSPIGMGLGGGDYQPPNPHHPQQQNGFPPMNGFPPAKHAPPHFGPPPFNPPQQRPPQNPAQSSFPPGSPYNRPTRGLPPPSEPQTQALRSNSMGPQPMMRSSSAAGSEPSGYPAHSNGGTPQPQRLPPFAPPPQRQSSIPRSASPVKRAPSTPAHQEPMATMPPVAPPAPSLPPPLAAPGPPPAPISSLPPLPASVTLNPAITRVTVVPLATSLTTIPPVSADEVAAVKEWMEADRAYEGVFREMKTRAGAELRELMGPPSIPWWEKGSLDGNASRFLQGREKFEVKYPYRRRERDSRKKPPKREGLKLPRKDDPEDANRPEELVPIRLEFDVDHHKIRDTFVWNMNASVVSPDHFAQTVIEDYNLSPSHHGVIVKAIQDQLSDYRAHSANYDGDSWNVVRADDTLRAGTLEGESAEWWCNWRKRLRTEYGFMRAERNKRRKRRKLVKDEPENEQPMSVEEFAVNDKTLHEDMRILIRLDIIVGSMKLDDQFEWDLDNEQASPEEFAEVYAQELGLGGEFKTAIVHSIREQVHAYQKCLYLVGHQDEDLRNSFLPSLASGARTMDQVQAFTPLLNYLSDGELERNEKERDKEYNKRRKKGRGGRRGVALPDRDPIRTCRTPAIGFPDPDPATLAAAAAATAPMSRRAAAAAASLTIANLVASENGERSYTPSSSLPALPPPPPLIIKEKTTKGFFKPPPYDTAVLRPRAKIPAPIPSTAADVSKLPAPVENDPPPPPPTPVVVHDRAPRAVTAKRAKELEREAKDKEFATGQQQNMIDGVWHCSNCGCPEGIAVGRRKGPLGDKSQCGTCGKYWHRYRKPRPVEYNSDYDFHATGLKKDADSRRRRGRAAAPTPADTSEPPTPRDSGEGTSRQSPVRDVSPVSTASTASEMPLAQRVKINHASTPSAAQSPVVSSTSIPPPASSSSPHLSASHSTETRPTSAPAPPAPPPAPAVPLPPKPTQPPQWLSTAMGAMHARYHEDRFEVICKPNVSGWEWRIKCLDCPGKLYITGGGETLNNFELHLKNRLHRKRVTDRVHDPTIA